MFYLQSEKGVVEDTQGLVEAVVFEGHLHVIDVRINGNLYDAYGHPLLTDLDRGTGIAGCNGGVVFRLFVPLTTCLHRPFEVEGSHGYPHSGRIVDDGIGDLQEPHPGTGTDVIPQRRVGDELQPVVVTVDLNRLGDLQHLDGVILLKAVVADGVVLGDGNI